MLQKMFSDWLLNGYKLGLELDLDSATTIGRNPLHIICGLFVGVPIAAWIYRKFLNRIARLNLPGPVVAPFTGDILDFHHHEYQLHLLLDEYYKKYGKIFAFYHQGQPVICVANEKIIHEILWKEYKNFPNRKFFIDLPFPCHSMITMITGPKAKLIRALLKTLLDATSINNMASHIKDAVGTTEKLLHDAEMNEKWIDAAGISQGYVMEILAKIGFSVDAKNQTELNNNLVALSHGFVQPPSWVNLVAAVPLGRHFLKYIPSAYQNQLKPLLDLAIKLVTERRVDKHSTKKDVLTALLSAQESKLLDSDLFAQGVVLLTAVQVATSTTITIATYYIAKHFEVQSKIQQEIDEFSNEDDFPTAEHLHRLKYLDNVIKEVLRLYPSGFMLMRDCTKATTIENIHFEKGDAVLIPTYSMHRDEKVFKNPEEFNPDRFKQEKPTSSQYHPFGDGIRMCIGKQMALTEMKLYLAQLLNKYQITLANEKQKLKVRSHLTVQAMMIVQEPIPLSIVSRRRRPATP